MEKVTVSKEVAEALDGLKVRFSDDRILALLSSGKTDREVRMFHGSTVVEYRTLIRGKMTPMETARALILGYKVEKTKEEKFVGSYAHHADIVAFYKRPTRHKLDDCEREQERYSSGYVAGVKDFAKAYGIKIEGVNV